MSTRRVLVYEMQPPHPTRIRLLNSAQILILSQNMRNVLKGYMQKHFSDLFAFFWLNKIFISSLFANLILKR